MKRTAKETSLHVLMAWAILGLCLVAPAMSVAAAERPAAAHLGDSAAAACDPEYSVEYRDAERTGGHWRVACAWTTDYSYAAYIYDYMANLGYEVRFYVR